MPDFDPMLYNRPPVINVASGFALGSALIAALPENPPDVILRSAHILRTALVALQAAWLDQSKAPQQLNRRAAHQASDNSWSALEGRITAYTLLPADRFPLVARAREIHQAVFDTGWSVRRL